MARVTSIEFQKKNKDRVNLYVDGTYLMSMYAEMVYKYNISVNSEIDQERLTEIIKADDYEKAKNKALNYISRVERSEKKVREKLQDEFDQVKGRYMLVEYQNNRYGHGFFKEILIC